MALMPLEPMTAPSPPRPAARQGRSSIKKVRELGFPKVPELAHGALEHLSRYHWSGNVRELENLVERALILNRGGPIVSNNLVENQEYGNTKNTNPIEPDNLLLDQVIAEHVRSVLKMTGGKVNGENGAAELMGMNPSTLRHKMRKMNIPFGRNVFKKGR